MAGIIKILLSPVGLVGPTGIGDLRLTRITGTTRSQGV